MNQQLQTLAQIQRPKQPLLLVLPNKDISCTVPLRGLFNKYFGTIRPIGRRLTMKSELAIECKLANTTLIATTCFTTLKLVDPYLEGTENENIGTCINFRSPIDPSVELRIILLPSLAQQFTVNHGTFLIDHFCKKLALGGILSKDSFNWEFCTPSNLNAIAARINESSFLVAVDIETSRDDLNITSVSYTAGFLEEVGSGTPSLEHSPESREAGSNGTSIPESSIRVGGDSNEGKSGGNLPRITQRIRTETYVVPCNHESYPFCIDAVRVLNLTLPPKVMQNGQYDATYFLRFDAPLYNWLYDTYTMAHAIYAELPKTLSFISSFYLDNYRFWKDESGRNLYEYNAKDTHNTFWVWLAQIAHVPTYGVQNYLKKFPSVFPCLSCALDGMVVNEETKQRLHAEETAKKLAAQDALRFLLSEPDFNPGSPIQSVQMFFALGYTPGKNQGGKYSSDAKNMQKFKETSPLYSRIADYMTQYREAAKAIGTYFEVTLLEGYYHDTGINAPLRLMYSIDPSGTETGRFASKESAFWCGTQIQNIPAYARVMCEADRGWIFGAVDKSQAESYCTGYISGDTNLIHAVTTSPDFHCHNASMFFGLPFTELYDQFWVCPKSGKLGKKLNKLIRDIAKRVNHGANYNMGWQVLWETMGTKEVLMAKQLLRLPPQMTIRAVCEYLLQCFDKTYPVIRGPWYNSIISEISRTGMLVTPTGYTRRTFLQPHKSKMQLNSAVAHKPQSLSSELVEQAFVKIYHELQMKKYYGKFRLKAQVHDEIIFIATPDVIEAALEDVAQMMVIPIEINGRLMTIPSTKISGLKWSDLKD